MKKIIALMLAVLTVCTVFAFAACKKDDKKEEEAKGLGTFISVKHKYNVDTEWVEDTGWELELNADGKGVSKRDGNEYELTWELDGEEITIKETFMGITNEYNGTIKDGELSFFNGDPADNLTCEYIFNKK